MDAWPSWSFVETFKPPNVHRLPQWQPIAQWVRLARGAAESAERDIAVLLRSSDAKLRQLGGDPSGPDCPDWTRFRPLRLSREEDWSDWLAHLLESSPTGAFASFLFGKHLDEAHLFAHPLAQREVATESRRADIVVHWKTGDIGHIEVKIGDENFDKTFETAREIARAHATVATTNYILLPPWSRAAWDRCVADHVATGISVEALDWVDLAIAIRRALPEATTPWSIWAWTSCGCLERKVLLVGSRHLATTPMGRLETATRFRHILIGARDG